MKPNRISNYITYQREKANLTQQQLADKAGIGIHFIRDLEQGKELEWMAKLNKVLSLFDSGLVPGDIKLADAYHILNRHMQKRVEIVLRSKERKHGYLLGLVYQDGQPFAWAFVDHKDKNKYRTRGGEKYISDIKHAEILSVRNL